MSRTAPISIFAGPRTALAVLLTIFFAAPAWAQEPDPAAVEPAPEAAVAEATEEAKPKKDAPPKIADPKTKAKLDSDPRFTTPPPSLDATTHDLLLLNSGEWLQGNIDGIRDDKIEFDSVELEDLVIDLDDVKEIHANRFHTYRFEGRRDVLTGPARMNAEIFVVGNQERPRKQLMAQVPGKQRERNYWNGDFSVGYSVRSGNTNQSDLTARAEINRETAVTRFTNVYNLALSTAENVATSEQEKTANSHRVNSKFDYFVTNRFYLIVPSVEVFVDEFQNIDLRVTPGAGLGYEVLKMKYVTWDVSAQGGAQYTNLKSALAGEPESGTEAVVVLGTKIETDPTKDIEWDTTYQVQVVPANIDLTNHHLESILSIDLFFNLDFDVTFIWDRIEQPRANADGVVPVSNDYRMTFGVGWDF